MLYFLKKPTFSHLDVSSRDTCMITWRPPDEQLPDIQLRLPNGKSIKPQILIVDHEQEEHEDETVATELSSSLNDLKLDEEWNQLTVSQKNTFKYAAPLRLEKMSKHMKNAKVILAVLLFSDEEDEWTSFEANRIAKDLLKEIQPSKENMADLLKEVKACFKRPPPATVSTAGRLSTTADAPMHFTSDIDTEQVWKKECPQVHHVIRHVLTKSAPNWLHELWHLFVPPLMSTILDWEVHWKLRGLHLAKLLLLRAPRHVLTQTGMLTLLQSAMFKCLTFFESQYFALASDIFFETGPDDLAHIRLLKEVLFNAWIHKTTQEPLIYQTYVILLRIIPTLDTDLDRYLMQILEQLLTTCSQPLFLQPERCQIKACECLQQLALTLPHAMSQKQGSSTYAEHIILNLAKLYYQGKENVRQAAISVVRHLQGVETVKRLIELDRIFLPLAVGVT